MNTKNKSTTGFGVFIPALCIAIYLFALVQGTLRLYLSIDKCRITAEQEFSRIASLALSAGLQGFMDEHFVETINNALISSKNIEAVIITGPESEYAFERRQGYAVAWVNNSPRFINRFVFSSQSHYRPLPIHDLRNANIKAVASAYDFSEMTSILKETLLIILAGFAIAFFTMLIQLLTGKSSEEDEVTIPAELTTPIAEQAPLSAPPPAPPYEKAFQNIASDPKGLYSPRSNIGWEEYINDRLDSELHRCSSTENDLVFFLMEFADFTNDIMYKNAAEEAVSFFSSRDLLFEFGKHGIAVILPGIDLDSGISKSQKFYQRILQKFPNSHKLSSGFYIGLSSRSGRLLNADRLILEANEALYKAKHEPKSPIMAFKSDPEKYRDFLSKQNH